MKLQELFAKIKEDSLTKEQLEHFHREMSEVYAMMHLELGDIKKRKAMFMLTDPEKTAVAKSREWGGTQDGQREITLKSYIKATSTHLSSLRSRLYNLY